VQAPTTRALGVPQEGQAGAGADAVVEEGDGHGDGLLGWGGHVVFVSEV